MTISLEEDVRAAGAVRIEYHMTVPARSMKALGMRGNVGRGRSVAAQRRDRAAGHYVRVTAPGARSVDITTRFTNTARYHRLRVLFSRGGDQDVPCGDPFDVVKRATTHGPDSPQASNATFPMQRFVDVADRRGGWRSSTTVCVSMITPDDAAVLTLVRAYEIADDGQQTLERHPDGTVAMPGRA